MVFSEMGLGGLNGAVRTSKRFFCAPQVKAIGNAGLCPSSALNLRGQQRSTGVCCAGPVGPAV